ncbi:MAG: hypothetical protein ACLVD1_08020 [Lacrimispora saccharolytica]
MLIKGTILANYWSLKDSISETIAPKKFKEKREKMRQTDLYKDIVRYFDLVEKENLGYLLAVGESMETAYACADIIDKAEEAKIPLASAALDDLMNVTGYSKEEIQLAIDKRILVAFIKGKGISEELESSIKEIRNKINSADINENMDIDEIADKTNVPVDRLKEIGELAKEYSEYKSNAEKYNDILEFIQYHKDFGKKNPVDIGVELGYSEEQVIGSIKWVASRNKKAE